MSPVAKHMKKIRAKVSGENGNAAYITLPRHPDKDFAKTVALDDLLKYVGPRVHLDLDSEGRLIGIEVLCFGSDDVPV
jgi:hypothetical protein